MIRIITHTRLATLRQDADQARERAREVQECADAAYARHVRTVHDLTAEADAAERAAEAARVQVEDLTQVLERVRAELVQTRGTVAEQAARIEALSEPAAGTSMVLLLHFGEPHSIHPDQSAAYAYAATLGAPLNGWVPVSERPAAELRWRCVPFIYDATGDHFRSVVAPVVEPVGGAG